MSANVTGSIKIYHIVHISRLPSIIADGHLFSDAEISKRPQAGETIGMSKIKDRRLRIPLTSHPGLHIGECVPFYFCPRSVMLYLWHMANHEDVDYRGWQEPVVHLVSDLHKTVEWAQKNGLRWAFTDSNAGSYYFEDFANLDALGKIDWQAIQANQWGDSNIKEKKQAEFLIERCFPWEIVEEIGVYSYQQLQAVHNAARNPPPVKVQRSWYY